LDNNPPGKLQPLVPCCPTVYSILYTVRKDKLNIRERGLYVKKRSKFPHSVIEDYEKDATGFDTKRSQGFYLGI
jgi:hypothetical protein